MIHNGSIFQTRLMGGREWLVVRSLQSEELIFNFIEKNKISEKDAKSDSKDRGQKSTTT